MGLRSDDEQSAKDLGGEQLHDDDSFRAPTASAHLTLWLQRILVKPGWTIAVLGGIAFGIELAQQWPELVAGGHALGEFVRNLAYALIGAVLFNWVLIEVPAARRRRIAYARNQLGLDFLVKAGPIWLAEYRGVAHQTAASYSDPDAWDRGSIEKCARSIYEVNPGYFGESRRKMLSLGIHGMQLTLDGVEAASYFFDPDVAVALALFPAEKGLHQLQPPAPDDPDPWKRDVHIIWELLEASRRLYAALQACAPYVKITVTDGSATLSDGTNWHARLGDVSRHARSS